MHQEYQYLEAVRHILTNGIRRPNRTGIDTLSVFGMQMRWNLRTSFPILTTKRVYWKGIVEELLWFIKGSTDSGILSSKGVKIWDANGSGRGGDLGPIYGWQWRHYGAEYTTKDDDYTGKGIDQLADIISKLKTDPYNRRLCMTSWNPIDIDKMVLPPCHCFSQFYVTNGELSCMLYQRSGDMGLGVPFNISSYALLVYIMATVVGLRPGDLVHTIGDAHVYVNHIEPLKIQVEREPRPFPIVTIRPKDDIDAFTPEDIIMEGYQPHDRIPMVIAV